MDPVEDCVSMVPCRPVESGWIALEGYVPECNLVPQTQ